MASQVFQGFLTNKTCQICSEDEATHFCNCKNPPILYCIPCFAVHYAKDTRTIHHTIPIAALGKDHEEYQRKNEDLKIGKTALLKNLEIIEKFIFDFDELMKNSIQYLTDYRIWYLKYLQTEKDSLSAAIEAAITETTSCLDQGTAPGAALSRALWILPAKELILVDCAVTTPDLQALYQGCATYCSRMQDICERFPQEIEQVKDSVMLKLSELCEKHAISAHIHKNWSNSLQTLQFAHQLEPLLQKIILFQQISTEIIVKFINSTLILCTWKQEEVAEIGKNLGLLLEMQGNMPFLANLGELIDSELVATLLDAARWQPNGPILAACIELSGFFVILQRNNVQIPNFLPSLQHKPAETAQLAKLCSKLLLNPSQHMAELSVRLIEALDSATKAESLLFVAELSADLLQKTPIERVRELGFLLVTAVLDVDQMDKVEKLKAQRVQMRDKLVSMLNSPENLTIDLLKSLILPLSEAPREVSRKPDALIPEYRKFSQGLIFKSKCNSSGCAAYGEVIYINKGLGSFDIGVHSVTLVCPLCRNKAEAAASCGFYLAKWKSTGFNQEGEEIVMQGKTMTREYYTWEDVEQTNWVQLRVQVDAYTP